MMLRLSATASLVTEPQYIDLDLVPGADEVSGVMVAGYYHTCCW
jgi:hypothetical protein